MNNAVSPVAANNISVKSNPHICFLGLGSNLNNPHAQLCQAINQLAQRESIEIIKISPFYQSKALGFENQADFLNAVIKITTTLTPLSLLFVCQTIEQQLGHSLKQRWGPREIDIDILLYSNKTFFFEQLIIPHKGLMQRNFMLQPLCDIAPTLKLPGGQMIKNMLINKHGLARSPFQYS